MSYATIPDQQSMALDLVRNRASLAALGALPTLVSEQAASGPMD